METAISKLDHKKYFKTYARFAASADDRYSFIEGENYWVRNVDEHDNVEADKYCIVKGTFNCAYDALAHALDRNAINRYNGTYSFKVIVPKVCAKLALEYCD